MNALPKLATAMNSSGNPDVLRTIGMPGVALAVWSPEQPQGLQIWIDALPAEKLPRLRATLPPQQARESVATACERAGTPAGAYRDHLVDRAAVLASLASEILASLLVELRLDVTSGQACPKWHLDSVHARLFCTMRGPGTEFGPAQPDGTPIVIHRLPTGAAASSAACSGRAGESRGSSTALPRRHPRGHRRSEPRHRRHRWRRGTGQRHRGQQVAKAPFDLVELFSDRRSYFLNFKQWARNLERARDFVRDEFGEFEYRKFQLYLWGAAYEFFSHNLDCYPMVLYKRMVLYKTKTASF